MSESSAIRAEFSIATELLASMIASAFAVAMRSVTVLLVVPSTVASPTRRSSCAFADARVAASPAIISAPRSVRTCVSATARARISSVMFCAFAASAPVARVISESKRPSIRTSSLVARVTSAVI
jgi:hypothetical protein